MSNRILNIIAMTLTAVLIFPATGFSQKPDSVIIKKKNPTGALFRSVFVPGWGQFYNRKYIKSALIAGIEVYLINEVYTHWHKADLHRKHFTSALDNPTYQASEFALYNKELDRRGNATWFLAATIFFSMFDAYVDAQLSDFDQTDKAFSFYIGPGDNEEVVATVTFNLP